MLKNLLKQSFLWIAFLLIFFVVFFSFVPSAKQFNKSFSGEAEKFKYPGFSKNSLQSHEFQKYTEALFEKNIRLRKQLITIHNQLYFYLFKKTYAENSTLIIGKNNQFIELHYIIDYCRKNNDLPTLTKWADQIADLDRYFITQGKTFIYVITPSKAEYMSEIIPNRFHCKKRGIKEDISQMDELLTERNVIHINGPELMVKTSQLYNIDLFPPGGIHWNWLGSSVEAASIVKALQLKTPFPLPNIQFTYTLGKPKKEDSDRDILSLAQLSEHALNYKVPHIKFQNSLYQGKPITLSVIGGSFTWSLIRIFLENKLFAEINYYFYFNKFDKVYRADQKLNWSDDINLAGIFKSDIIMLEENSAMLVSEHGKKFYKKIMENHA